MNTLSRRQFILRLLPAVAATQAAQWPYSPAPAESAPPDEGADTALNLTRRVTALEWLATLNQTVDIEQGRALAYLSKFAPPVPYFRSVRPRRA